MTDIRSLERTLLDNLPWNIYEAGRECKRKMRSPPPGQRTGLITIGREVHPYLPCHGLEIASMSRVSFEFLGRAQVSSCDQSSMRAFFAHED